MKTFLSLRSLVLILALPAAAGLPARAAEKLASAALLENGLPPGVHTLKIGDRAPDFSLLGVDGKTYSLADFKDSPLLMVVFMSNHCAVSHAAETRLFPYIAELKKRGIGLSVVAINPNNPDALRIEELDYSKYNDSYAEMKLYAKEQNFPIPYLYDGDTQKTAMAYGCLCTPHVFIFDRERRLQYTGRFDNSRLPDPASVTVSDAPRAVDALWTGQPVPVPVTRAVGCSTKWMLKNADVAQANEEWDHAPVTVDPIDAAGVAALAHNNTKKFRLVNVWATWCAPCVEEFPGLVSISRQFAMRNFDLITVSLDDPKEQATVLKFLQRQHAAVPSHDQPSILKEGRRTNAYFYTGANADTFGQALDSQWPGPLPYTVLIAPGGEIVYRHSGELDLAEVKGVLVDKMGRFYDQERIRAVR